MSDKRSLHEAVGRVRCHGAKGARRKDASWLSLVQLNFESYTSLQKRKFVGLPDLSMLRKKDKKKKKTKRKRRKDTTSEESCLAKEVLDFVPLYIVFDLALLLHWRMPCVAGYTRRKVVVAFQGRGDLLPLQNQVQPKDSSSTKSAPQLTL